MRRLGRRTPRSNTEGKGQLHFPWIPQDFRHNCWRKRLWRRRTPIRKLEWPPRIGQKVAFETNGGIRIGALREVRAGLACRMYVMADGRIAMEHKIVMGPETPNWRDPDTVPDSELQACIKRVQAAHDAHPEQDLRKMPEAWADFCQIAGYVWRKGEKEKERKLAMMETPGPEMSRPN
jgi:hypothetical protein